MPWRNTSLRLYHGTILPYAATIAAHGSGVLNGISLAPCKRRRDFGKGFYTTRILSQARRFAEYKYRFALHDHQTNGSIDPQAAAVVEFTINLDAISDLKTLAFVQGAADWRSFVNYCRSTGKSHKANNNYYDVVYGSVDSKSGMIHSLEQISFHTTYAISLLHAGTIMQWMPS